LVHGLGDVSYWSALSCKNNDNLYSAILCQELEGLILAETGFWLRKNTVKKILRNLEGTTKENAKTRRELNVGILQIPILDSLVDKEIEDEQGRKVKVKKTPNDKYYLEKV